MLIKAKSMNKQLQGVVEQMNGRQQVEVEPVLPERGFYFNGMPRVLPQPAPFSASARNVLTAQAYMKQNSSLELKSKTQQLKELLNSIKP